MPEVVQEEKINSDRPTSARAKMQEKKNDRMKKNAEQKSKEWLNLDSAETQKALKLMGGANLIDMFKSNKTGENTPIEMQKQ